MSSTPYSHLAKTLEGELHTDRVYRDLYSCAAGLYRIRPTAVVIPKSEADVMRTVLFANKHNIPLTVRGAGSSLAGQALTTGIVIDTTKHLTKIRYYDDSRNIIVVEPGAVLDNVNAFLAAYGKQLGFLPSSSSVATVGGAIANNASGARSIRLGDARRYVKTLDVILADGSAIKTDALAVTSDAFKARCEEASLRGAITREVYAMCRDEGARIKEGSVSLAKNSSGYALDKVLVNGVFDLTPLFVGSEGTLGIITSAVLSVVPLAKHKATVLFYCASLADAVHAVAKLTPLSPSALEIMDNNFITLVRREVREFRTRLPETLHTAILLEFEGDDIATVRDRARSAMESIVKEEHLAFDAKLATEERGIERLWKLRKSMVPLLNRLSTTKLATPFIEDIAVPPEHLSSFIETIDGILTKHGLKDAFAIFGHAGEGNLHIRPLLDLKNHEDVEKMRAILTEVVPVVRRLNGTLAGEHGDGRLRTFFLPFMFEAIYPFFLRVKSVFDEKNILNPRVIATETPDSPFENLRLSGEYERVALPYKVMTERQVRALDEAERCNGCGECRTFCPAFLATESELASPRGKNTLIRINNANQSEEAGWFFKNARAYKPLFDMCLLCGRCEHLCPANLATGKNVYALKEDWVARKGAPRSDSAAANTNFFVSLGRATSGIANAFLASGPGKAFLRGMFGFSAKKTFPRFTKQKTFSINEDENIASGTRIALFHGCFTKGYAPHVLEEYATLLQKAGAHVVVPKDQVCCALPARAGGMTKQVHKAIEENLAAFTPLLKRGYTVVTPCPSCEMMITREWRTFAETDEEREMLDLVAKNVTTLDKYIISLFRDIPKKPERKKYLYFTPCHEKEHAVSPHRTILTALPTVEVVGAIDDVCCGSAGTYSMKAYTEEISGALKRALRERLSRYDDTITIVTPCGMCLEQIKSVTRANVVHPADVYASVLSEVRFGGVR